MRAAARMILQLQYGDHVTTMIREQLHWLDASSRIRYKLCVFGYRCLNNLASNYLAHYYCVPVASVSGRSRLRSATAGELITPTCLTRTMGPRAFAFSCPSSWNSLPSDLRVLGLSLAVLKKKLKTVLFSRMLSSN